MKKQLLFLTIILLSTAFVTAGYKDNIDMNTGSGSPSNSGYLNQGSGSSLYNETTSTYKGIPTPLINISPTDTLAPMPKAPNNDGFYYGKQITLQGQKYQLYLVPIKPENLGKRTASARYYYIFNNYGIKLLVKQNDNGKWELTPKVVKRHSLLVNGKKCTARTVEIGTMDSKNIVTAVQILRDGQWKTVRQTPMGDWVVVTRGN